jgi:very-short-patch-repair endonuclease
VAHDMGEQPQRDARRDAWLKGQGLRVIRFAATDVMRDLDSVVTAITLACRR